MKFFQSAALALAMTSTLFSADWPRWMGADRDGVWKEDGIRKDLPAEGAKVLWRSPISWGYSAPVVSNGKIFVADFERSQGELINNAGKAVVWKGKERLHCLDLETGKTIWTTAVDRNNYKLSYPGGPRATPTVDGDRVYFLGAMGHFYCASAKDGQILWQKDFTKEFNAPQPIWGFAASPLVHGDLVYSIVGGPGSVVVAFDKLTGEVKWSGLDSEKQGYCPPSLVKAGGVEQLLIWHPEALNGLNPETGEVYWSLPLKPNFGMSVMMPQVSENKLFASGIGRVAALIKLDEQKPAASFIWRGKPKTAVYSCNSTPLIVDGVIYGADIDSSELIAASLEDGERFWSTPEPVTDPAHRRGGRHGTAFLTYHAGNKQFWIFNEAGHLILAKLSPKGYEEIGRQALLKPTNEAFGRPVVWSAPAFAEKSVIVRNDQEIIRVDLAE